VAGSVRDQVTQWTTVAGERALHRIERYIERSSLVETTPFLSPASFPWAAKLEENWKTIRTELEDVLSFQESLPNFQDISTDQKELTDDDRWKTFFFYGYGFRSDANCERCPKTAGLLARVPGMTTAFFSILAPHKQIPSHRGPWKGVIRYHLALMIPEPADQSGIEVGGEVRHWVEGGSLFFDDSYEHRAWNDTDATRVVLFMDVLRPLRRPAADLNKGIIKAIGYSPFIQDAKRRHNAWEQRFEKLRK